MEEYTWLFYIRKKKTRNWLFQNKHVIPADEDLLVVQQHAVDLLDGVHGGLLSLKMDESIAL